jgi:4-hydroxy-tetrahydrodipicolinate synthase
MVNLAAKRSRVPLLVNVSHSTLDGAVELARAAAAASVAGVLLMPPYYVHQSQDAIRAFYHAFAAEIGETTPIYLYNIPACTTGIESSVAAELLSTGLFAGIKDSSGSLEYFQALSQQADKTPFTLLAGHERIYEQCRGLGAKGIVSGVASALPELMVSLDKALVAGAKERSGQLQTLLAEFLQRVEIFPWPAGVKEAARRRGLKAGALAVPLGGEHQRKLTEFGEWFQGWLPQVLRESCK